MMMFLIFTVVCALSPVFRGRTPTSSLSSRCSRHLRRKNDAFVDDAKSSSERRKRHRSKREMMMRFNRRVFCFGLLIASSSERRSLSACDVSNKNGDKIKRSSPRLNTKKRFILSSLISLVGSRFRVTLFERKKITLLRFFFSLFALCVESK